jgi:hypothetical protein
MRRTTPLASSAFYAIVSQDTGGRTAGAPPAPAPRANFLGAVWFLSAATLALLLGVWYRRRRRRPPRPR